MMKKTIIYDRTFWILLLVCVLTTIPFLGLADFNTKGEPREAVVALSMLDSGNWILPTNTGGEMPYKPPFFHWCIAAFSYILGGHVTEFTSRLPSAVALIAMTMMTFVFFRRRSDINTALLTSLIAFTTFELHRAGSNCRVDMMLTFLTVGALFLLFRRCEKGLRGIPFWAILFMSLATLTKGPVGTLIPCLVTGIYLLLRGENFFRAFLTLTFWGLLSLILPLLWYYAAWQQGGQEFLDLVMEENFGRMTSTMSYDSCVNPWYYNFGVLLSGFLPWTLLGVMSLFVLHYRRMHIGPVAMWPTRLSRTIRDAQPVALFAATAALTIFIFYCFPQSKRSVYLMPMYPFAAYWFTRYMIYLSRDRQGFIKAYGDVLATLSVLVFVAFIAIKAGLVPDGVFGNGRHSPENVAMMHSVGDISGAGAWLMLLMTPVAAAFWWAGARRHVRHEGLLYCLAGVTMAIYLALSGAYQPAVLNAKSVKAEAAAIDRVAPSSEGELYEFISAGEFAAGDPVHYFEINFYLGDRVSSFYRRRPAEGFLITGDTDAREYFPKFEAEGYKFEEVYTLPSYRPEHTRVYRFSR